MRSSNVIKFSLLIFSIAMSGLSGCSSSLNEIAFMNTQGNTLNLVQDKDTVKNVVISTLTEKGFQTEYNSNLIKGTKKIQDGSKTITVTMDCSLLDTPGGGTRLQTAAMKEVYESSTHVKVFWLIFIPIPYGTYMTGAVVASDTIYEKEFYANFFDGVKKNLDQQNPVVDESKMHMIPAIKPDTSVTIPPTDAPTKIPTITQPTTPTTTTTTNPTTTETAAPTTNPTTTQTTTP